MHVAGKMYCNVAQEYPDYLRDESRRVGEADTISFPASAGEVAETLRRLSQSQIPVTLQGARTGITAGAVPSGGHIMNLSRMNGFLRLSRTGDNDGYVVTVQPGLVLADLRAALAAREFPFTGGFQDDAAPREHKAAVESFRNDRAYFFPPDPTEASASIGGMISCNASGALSFLYGPTRQYIERLRIVLCDGSELDLRRGVHRSMGRCFELETSTGRIIRGTLPAYIMPSVKNASGYFAADDMDMVDLFIGAEGTLGVIVEADLRLVPAPAEQWGVMAFMPSTASALDLAESARQCACRPAAIEFFDSRSLNLLRSARKSNQAFARLPELSPDWATAIYVEFHGEAVQLEAAVEDMASRIAETGGDADNAWLASEASEIERMKYFRHAVPELVNLAIDSIRRSQPGITKLGTDLAVPDACLRDVVDMYCSDLDLAGLDYVVFGHIGSNHVHVNILPRDMAEYDAGKNVYLSWAVKAVGMGGTVSAEHGIGKLKKPLLALMYGDDGLAQMMETKRLFDPGFSLNRGNLF